MHSKIVWPVLALALVVAGCKGTGANNSSDNTASQAAAAPAQPTLGEAVKPNGTVHEVKMIADAKGARFEPKDLTVKSGDVVKFVLASGAHNVHFLADKNPGAQGLPPMSDVLQLPGQTYELLVGARPGTYNFQCDPHAPLGMVGTLTVQ